MTMTRFSGGCLCGEVRYEVEADPAFSGFCHCRDCQRTTGGGHSAIAAFPAAAIRVTRGETTKYRSTGSSGGAVTREFCGRCGSALFSHAELSGPLMMVTAGTLDDSTGLAPYVHIFGKDRQPWDHVPPDHTVFELTPPRPPAGA
jgi:hypothetical protein